MTEEAPSEAQDAAGEPEAPGSGAAEPSAGTVLKGTPIAPGLALGVVHRKGDELEGTAMERVPRERVEAELNRFRGALVSARAQLKELKGRISGHVPTDDVRILDVHVAYLKDSVFISDVENLILNEQLALEAAIAKVIADFDRIFRLVQNETLRERAVDLRDVGLRVLRQLEQDPPESAASAEPSEGGGDGEDEAPPEPATDYVLVAKELSIVDMFNVSGDHVRAILTVDGSLTSHAAVLARSMRIPTITGVEGLLEEVREGDFVIVDATEGIVRVNPDERVRDQYRSERDAEPHMYIGGGVPTATTQDGERVELFATCGNLPEVEQAVTSGLRAIGLYRTELLFVVDRNPPTREALVQHYAAVVEEARGTPVTFRLLHADSTLELPYLHAGRELNPALGNAGVRALFANERVLRGQLEAILRAGVGAQVRVVIPFVTDNGDLRRVREILFEERLALKRGGVAYLEDLELGVVIETPAALLGARDLARESDFVVVGLDSLTQYLLAADRESGDQAQRFESLHPFVVRGLAQIVEACREEGRPLSVFGSMARQRHNLPFLLGTGLRAFCVPPMNARELAQEVSQVDVRNAERAARTARSSSCPADTLSWVDAFRHGYASS